MNKPNWFFSIPHALCPEPTGMFNFNQLFSNTYLLRTLLSNLLNLSGKVRFLIIQ